MLGFWPEFCSTHVLPTSTAVREACAVLETGPATNAAICSLLGMPSAGGVERPRALVHMQAQALKLQQHRIRMAPGQETGRARSATVLCSPVEANAANVARTGRQALPPRLRLLPRRLLAVRVATGRVPPVETSCSPAEAIVGNVAPASPEPALLRGMAKTGAVPNVVILCLAAEARAASVEPSAS